MDKFSQEALQQHEHEMKRDLKYNFILHTLEGGFFIIGLLFVNPNVVLPKILEELDGPIWMIAIAPVLFEIGLMAPTIFASYWIEQFQRMKPTVILWGIFQRIPFLIAALILIYLGTDYKTLCVWAAALSPFICGLLGGIAVPAWMELISKTFPYKHRAALMAARNAFAAVCGFLVGYLIKNVLEQYPGTTGYGILHMLCFGSMVISIILFFFVRESTLPPQAHKHHNPSLAKFWNKLINYIKEDTQLKRYLIFNLFSFSPMICLSFLSIHTLDILGKPEKFLGYLTVLHTVGWILGNTFGAILVNWVGIKFGVITGSIITLLVCFASIFTIEEWQFHWLFLFFGFGIGTVKIAAFALITELGPVERRISYLTLVMFTGMFGGIGLGVISAVLKHLDFIYSQKAIVSTILILISLVILTTIRDPRHRKDPLKS